MFSSIKIIALVVVTMFLGVTTFSQSTEKMVIYFDFNRFDLRSDGIRSLDSMLQPNEALITSVQIKGHCDKIGSDGYNDVLSLKRANTVKNYLLEKNIAPQIITLVEGHGKREPLNENLDAVQRALNRRVEIEITRTKTTVPVIPEETKTIAIPKEPEKTLTQQLTDSTAKEGSKIVLKNLNFIGGRHILVNESYPILDELLAVLKNNPSLKIEIQGHVCCTNKGDGYDLDTNIDNLSVARAHMVYDFLVENGISASRLKYRGFGSSQKLYPDEADEFQRAANRRVEIKILGK
jgi:outer membrane protein OmpA-like peptidoglycan-associated protein